MTFAVDFWVLSSLAMENPDVATARSVVWSHDYAGVTLLHQQRRVIPKSYHLMGQKAAKSTWRRPFGHTLARNL